MGLGSDPSMDRVILKEGGTGDVKQFRHVLVQPAFAHHAIRMHVAAEHYPPALYELRTDEETGRAFDVEIRDVGEHDAYTGEPFVKELAGLDMLDSIRAAPPDPTGEAVAVRGDNVPWDYGDHPALGQRHNDISRSCRECYRIPMHILIQSGGLSHIIIACIAIATMLHSVHSRY